MLPFKKILCPTDFSEPACKAINSASELAQTFAAELILLHVVAAIPAVDSPAGVTGFDVAAYQDELMNGAKRALEGRLAHRVPDAVHARTMVTMGDAAHEIARVADEEDVDLIVLASHGATGWRHRVFGSVAERVVRFADRPVLTVHCAPDGPEE